MSVVISWITPEIWAALAAILIAAAIDAALSIWIAWRARTFNWRKAPMFLYTNVLPYAVALLLGAVLVKFQPDLREEYLIAAAALAAWLGREWRAKAKLLMASFKAPQTPVS